MRERRVNSWSVVIDPDCPFFGGSIEGDRETCERIAAAVRRHVDEVQGVRVVADSEQVCSYCGERWTETSDTYNGGCCDEDEAGNTAEEEGA